MIPYELAKQLKDAGFPLNHFSHIPHFYKEISFIQKADETLGVPLLSELIESCGEEFECLIRRVHWGKEGEGIKDYSTLEWVAHGFKAASWNGSTPEEAVARLYLQLNKK